MREWRILAVALAAITAADGNAQIPANPPAPASLPPLVYRYPVSPQAGPWMVCVQTFKGDQAQMLAEEMAETLIRNYKLSAYLCERGRKEKAEEDERVRKLRQQFDEGVRQLRQQDENLLVTQMPFRVKTFQNLKDYQDEFAVLVAVPSRPSNDTEKDMETAREYLLKLRKLPPPPERFMNRAKFANEDASGKNFHATGEGYINPFQTAMVVHNPTVPIQKQQADPEKADDFLKKLNDGEELSVLKCSKPWTLVVKVYQGQTVTQAPASPGIMTSLGVGLGLIKKEPEILNAQTAQSRATADLLRKMKFEAYVMHQSSYSLVTVGQYDSPTDPNLMAIQRTLARLQLKAGDGRVLETLSERPLPMKIPR